VARIVVADDHELVRNGIKATLEMYPQLEVCGLAKDGQETIARVLELRPDIVILDLSMPVLSGFEAALKIRKLAPAVKIVVLSILDAPLVEQISYVVGAHAFLSKSASVQDLVSTVTSILDGTFAILPARSRKPSVAPDALHPRGN
jgi:DNA-binding NarL/FixJ family response regulator